MDGKKDVLTTILTDISCLKDDIDALKRLYSEQAKKLIDMEMYSESCDYTARCTELETLNAKVEQMVEVFKSLSHRVKLDGGAVDSAEDCAASGAGEDPCAEGDGAARREL